MRKIKILTFTAFGLFATACKKNYTCSCVTTNTSQSGTVFIYPAEEKTYVKVKRSTAKDLCTNRSDDYTSNSTTVYSTTGGADNTVSNSSTSAPSSTECKLK